MTDYKPDGGPAFAYGNHEQGGDSGMSLRDYFAGQIIAGICAHPEGTSGSFHNNCGPDPHEGMAKYAYKLADAMIVRRAQD